jgi:N4-gp56 family major capsid protein
MADTSFGVNHPLAVKAWRKRLHVESLKQMWFSKFIGSGPTSVIQKVDELRKGPGDRVRVGLRMQLSGSGIQGDATLEGNEEALTLYNDDVLINQVRHAVVSGGKMSEQRVPFSVREESMQALADWWAQRDEVAIANQLCGNTTQTNTAFTGNNLATAPSSNNLLVAGETAEASLSTAAAHQFSLTLLDRAVARAKTLTPMIKPIRINGDEYYVAFLHPFQVYQMRTSTSSVQWADIQKAAMAGARSADSPIFTGMLGMYNGVVLHECPYLPSFSLGSSTSAYRGVFAGAQAALWASGGDGSDSSMSWSEEMFDYGNKLGVSAGRIYGCKKAVFNSQDFGVITMATHSPQP